MLERLAFYRSDLLLAFVALPLLGSSLLYLIPRRYWIVCSVATAYAAIVFLYFQMHGYWMVGQFQSWHLWHDAVRWGSGTPRTHSTILAGSHC